MAGLLSDDWDDPRNQGLLALGLGLLGSRGSFAQGLSQAGQQAMGVYGAGRQRQRANMREDERDTQAQAAHQMQQQMAQIQLQQAQAAQQRQQQFQALAQQSARSPQQTAMGANGGPTLAAAQAVPTAQAGFDVPGYIKGLWGLDPERAIAMEASLRKDDAPMVLAEGARAFNRGGTEIASNPKAADLPSAVREFEYGQKNPAFNPWQMGLKRAGATNVQVDAGQRFENAYSSAQGKSFSDTMEAINKAGFNAPPQIRKLERMTQLLDGVDGGKLTAIGTDLASAANSIGIKIDPKLGNKEASQALAREIAGGFRQPGTGPMTDKDFENFLLQVPDLSKSAEGRKAITQTMRAALNRDIKMAKMARDYEKRTGRLDGGFTEEAAQFIAANPVVGNIPGWQGTDIGDGFSVKTK